MFVIVGCDFRRWARSAAVACGAEQTHSDELKHYRVLGIVDKVQYCVSILKLHCDRYWIQH